MDSGKKGTARRRICKPAIGAEDLSVIQSLAVWDDAMALAEARAPPPQTGVGPEWLEHLLDSKRTKTLRERSRRRGGRQRRSRVRWARR
jgi:hypothetical protein